MKAAISTKSRTASQASSPKSKLTSSMVSAQSPNRDVVTARSRGGSSRQKGIVPFQNSENRMSFKDNQTNSTQRIDTQTKKITTPRKDYSSSLKKFSPQKEQLNLENEILKREIQFLQNLISESVPLFSKITEEMNEESSILNKSSNYSLQLFEDTQKIKDMDFIKTNIIQMKMVCEGSLKVDSPYTSSFAEAENLNSTTNDERKLPATHRSNLKRAICKTIGTSRVKENRNIDEQPHSSARNVYSIDKRSKIGDLNRMGKNYNMPLSETRVSKQDDIQKLKGIITQLNSSKAYEHLKQKYLPNESCNFDSQNVTRNIKDSSQFNTNTNSINQYTFNEEDNAKTLTTNMNYMNRKLGFIEQTKSKSSPFDRFMPGKLKNIIQSTKELRIPAKMDLHYPKLINDHDNISETNISLSSFGSGSSSSLLEETTFHKQLDLPQTTELAKQESKIGLEQFKNEISQIDYSTQEFNNIQTKDYQFAHQIREVNFDKYVSNLGNLDDEICLRQKQYFQSVISNIDLPLSNKRESLEPLVQLFSYEPKQELLQIGDDCKFSKEDYIESQENIIAEVKIFENNQITSLEDSIPQMQYLDIMPNEKPHLEEANQVKTKHLSYQKNSRKCSPRNQINCPNDIQVKALSCFVNKDYDSLPKEQGKNLTFFNQQSDIPLVNFKWLSFKEKEQELVNLNQQAILLQQELVQEKQALLETEESLPKKEISDKIQQLQMQDVSEFLETIEMSQLMKNSIQYKTIEVVHDSNIHQEENTKKFQTFIRDQTLDQHIPTDSSLAEGDDQSPLISFDSVVDQKGLNGSNSKYQKLAESIKNLKLTLELNSDTDKQEKQQNHDIQILSLDELDISKTPTPRILGEIVSEIEQTQLPIKFYDQQLQKCQKEQIQFNQLTVIHEHLESVESEIVKSNITPKQDTNDNLMSFESTERKSQMDNLLQEFLKDNLKPNSDLKGCSLITRQKYTLISAQTSSEEQIVIKACDINMCTPFRDRIETSQDIQQSAYYGSSCASPNYENFGQAFPYEMGISPIRMKNNPNIIQLQDEKQENRFKRSNQPSIDNTNTLKQSSEEIKIEIQNSISLRASIQSHPSKIKQDDYNKFTSKLKKPTQIKTKQSVIVQKDLYKTPNKNNKESILISNTSQNNSILNQTQTVQPQKSLKEFSFATRAPTRGCSKNNSLKSSPIKPFISLNSNSMIEKPLEVQLEICEESILTEQPPSTTSNNEGKKKFDIELNDHIKVELDKLADILSQRELPKRASFIVQEHIQEEKSQTEQSIQNQSQQPQKKILRLSSSQIQTPRKESNQHNHQPILKKQQQLSIEKEALQQKIKAKEDKIQMIQQNKVEREKERNIQRQIKEKQRSADSRETKFNQTQKRSSSIIAPNSSQKDKSQMSKPLEINTNKSSMHSNVSAKYSSTSKGEKFTINLKKQYKEFKQMILTGGINNMNIETPSSSIVKTQSSTGHKDYIISMKDCFSPIVSEVQPTERQVEFFKKLQGDCLNRNKFKLQQSKLEVMHQTKRTKL